MSTSVPQIQFTPTGLVVPTEAAILAGVQTDMNAAFGGNLNPALTTAQGQLASSTSAIIADANGTIAELVNQVDPTNAEGFMQDAIGQIYFLTRKPGTSTAVQIVCTGGGGGVAVPIPLGAKIQDTSGNIYICTQAGTLPAGGGSVTLSFAAISLGPLPCPANTVNRIYQAITGWNTVNNPTPGVPGTNVESRVDFEFRRQNSVAANAHGSPQAIYGAVFGVANVTDAYVIDNQEDTTVLAGSTNYPLTPHSVYAAVVGGVANDIANAIWGKKDLGATSLGNTTIIVTDPSGYSNPLPSYNIRFNRPTALPMKFAVSIAASPGLPSNIVTLVQNAIVATFTGTDGRQRARIGALLLASSFYPGVSAIGANVSIVSLLLGPTVANLNSYLVGIDQVPTLNSADIIVTLV